MCVAQVGSLMREHKIYKDKWWCVLYSKKLIWNLVRNCVSILSEGLCETIRKLVNIKVELSALWDLACSDGGWSH